jgi:predicted alpha/beta-hydrolase family hydrolase
MRRWFSVLVAASAATALLVASGAAVVASGAEREAAVPATSSAIAETAAYTFLRSTPARPDPGDGLAVNAYYDTVRESADGLRDHTVYRPRHLGQFKRGTLPVMVWGNGACRTSNWGFITALTIVASHGFVVIAVGDPGMPAVPESNTPHPEKLVAAIDWAIAKNRGQFDGRLDTTKIATGGQSCGGLESLVAGQDPRVKSVISYNSGFFANGALGYTRDELKKLHSPVLFTNGGPTDVAYQNSIDNYNLVTVPAVLAEFTQAGHSGLLYGIRNGNGDTTVITAGTDLMTNWLDYTLNGKAKAGQQFLGPDCVLCSSPDWKVQSKGF